MNRQNATDLTIFVHYGHKQFLPDEFKIPVNAKWRNKPCGGLWASPVDSENGWRQWCHRETYRVCDEENSFRFTLAPGARVLRIDSVEAARALPVQSDSMEHPRITAYDFEKMARDGVDAIEFCLSEDPELYWEMYGWDCDSILILNPEVVVPMNQEEDI